MKYKSTIPFLIFCLLVLSNSNCSNSTKSTNILPTCVIISPTENTEIVQGNNLKIVVQADDEDGKIISVDYFIDEDKMVTITNEPYIFDWHITLSDTGEHIIKVIAMDDNNKKSGDELTIYVYEKLTSNITDIDGNVYTTVKIGKQWWMAENLKVTRYNNGDTIIDCWAYNNDESNVSKYGLLYSWDAVTDSRNIIPEGWHVPTDDEWEELAQHISDQNGNYRKIGNDWTEVGGHLKSISGWGSNGNGSDDYGFTSLPAGYTVNGYIRYYLDIGVYAYYWSSTEYDTNYALYRFMISHYNNFYCDCSNKGTGLSVRCVMD